MSEKRSIETHVDNDGDSFGVDKTPGGDEFMTWLESIRGKDVRLTVETKDAGEEWPS